MIINNIETIVGLLQALLKFIEVIDPAAAQNPVVMKIESALDELKAINL